MQLALLFCWFLKYSDLLPYMDVSMNIHNLYIGAAEVIEWIIRVVIYFQMYYISFVLHLCLVG